VGKKLRHSGPLLITHWGMSGPSIIKSSAWHAIELHDANYSCTMTINWLPELQPDHIQQSI
jgi:predicted flavoprotein YhiN